MKKDVLTLSAMRRVKKQHAGSFGEIIETEKYQDISMSIFIWMKCWK
jgi:hypothetical protein